MWDSQLAATFKPGDKLLWIHTKRSRFPDLESDDPRLKKAITIKSIQGDVIKTDFGSYKLADGKNTEIPCGCKRFCDCYGNVEILEKP